MPQITITHLCLIQSGVKLPIFGRLKYDNKLYSIHAAF